MKLEKAFMIEGKVVNQVFQKGNISVFQVMSGFGSEETFYFVDNKADTVLFKQEIGADMGQGMGFISGVDFEGVN